MTSVLKVSKVSNRSKRQENRDRPRARMRGRPRTKPCAATVYMVKETGQFIYCFSEKTFPVSYLTQVGSYVKGPGVSKLLSRARSKTTKPLKPTTRLCLYMGEKQVKKLHPALWTATQYHFLTLEGWQRFKAYYLT
jgi:hypothetical protein